MRALKSKGFEQSSIWLGAVLVGLAAVFYAKFVSLAQSLFFSAYRAHPYATAAFIPVLFLLATALVRLVAPDAKGSGIPQVLAAIEGSRDAVSPTGIWRSPQLSVRTAIVKVFSSVLGVLGGASIGREGPTVQIAASVFAAVGRKARDYVPRIELTSYLTAGAAAGVAAAFNTPIAGISFAIEELIDGAWGGFRQSLMLAVIIAGITAQAFMGDYLYFGHPAVGSPNLEVTYQSVLIGLLTGLSGGLFARVLAYPAFVKLPKHWILRTLVCGGLCSVLCLLTGAASAGSGYEATQRLLDSASVESADVWFPLYKAVATLFSYLSGMAGGIFSPTLAIGAGLGLGFAKVFHVVNFRACALMGMVGFFSGVVQAPLTAVIIVTEMTDRHVLILPFMIAAFLGQWGGRQFMASPLYRALAKPPGPAP